MAKEVYSNDYNNHYDDIFAITGLFQYSYKNKENDIQLKTFQDRIDYFFKKNTKFKGTVSEVVDTYIRFTYSTLDNYILPLVNIAESISVEYDEWHFGNNVKKMCSNFSNRYNKKFFGGFEFNKLNDNQKAIIQSLKEYGISLDGTINIEMIDEINKTLNLRYSSYDVINAIKKLSISSSPNKIIFKRILDTYVL